MAVKDKNKVNELHVKRMKESMQQIDESIRTGLHEPLEEKTPPTYGEAYKDPPATEVPAEVPREEGASSPDKVNEIRNQVSTARASVITDPDVQTELMDIIKQRCDAFEKEINQFVSDKKGVEAALQRFKDELMNNVRQQLTKKDVGD